MKPNLPAVKKGVTTKKAAAKKAAPAKKAGKPGPYAGKNKNDNSME